MNFEEISTSKKRGEIEKERLITQVKMINEGAEVGDGATIKVTGGSTIEGAKNEMEEQAGGYWEKIKELENIVKKLEGKNKELEGKIVDLKTELRDERDPNLKWFNKRYEGRRTISAARREEFLKTERYLESLGEDERERLIREVELKGSKRIGTVIMSPQEEEIMNYFYDKNSLEKFLREEGKM